MNDGHKIIGNYKAMGFSTVITFLNGKTDEILYYKDLDKKRLAVRESFSYEGNITTKKVFFYRGGVESDATISTEEVIINK
jgi:hypothetical protein